MAFSIVLVLVLLSLGLYFMQVLVLRRKLSELVQEGELPAISIIKPLKGLDDNLHDNLESFCRLDYPEYEVILSLEDYNDPAYRVAKKIADKYPNLVKIVVDNSHSALNPKVKNMIAAYEASKYEYFLISDSNVLVDRDYLRKTVALMTADTGLVTNLIMGVSGRSLGARLENLQLNSFIILSVSFLDKFLRMPCSIGKSMLMRKKDFERIGGFGAVKNLLAEDYMIGKLIHESGMKVKLSSYIIKNVNEYWSLKRFLNRHTRWAKIRWKIGGFKYFTEPLANPLFLTSILPLIDSFSRFSLSVFFGVLFAKIALDLYVSRLIKSKIGFSSLLIPVKDLITGLIWFVPLISSRINWRGNLYSIGKNTVIEPCESNTSLRLLFNKLKTSITG